MSRTIQSLQNQLEDTSDTEQSDKLMQLIDAARQGSAAVPVADVRTPVTAGAGSPRDASAEGGDPYASVSDPIAQIALRLGQIRARYASDQANPLYEHGVGDLSAEQAETDPLQALLSAYQKKLGVGQGSGTPTGGPQFANRPRSSVMAAAPQSIPSTRQSPYAAMSAKQQLVPLHTAALQGLLSILQNGGRGNFMPTDEIRTLLDEKTSNGL